MTVSSVETVSSIGTGAGGGTRWRDRRREFRGWGTGGRMFCFKAITEDGDFVVILLFSLGKAKRFNAHSRRVRLRFLSSLLTLPIVAPESVQNQALLDRLRNNV